MRLKVPDTSFSLIIWMAQGVCCYSLELGRQPMPHLSMGATIYHWGYPRYTAKNHWPSIDAHCQNKSVTVLLTLVPTKDASMLIIDSTNQVTFRLLYFRDEKSLTLYWHSFQCTVCSRSASINNCIYHYLNLVVAFQPSWELGLWQSKAQ
jgi:hypothetical protein